jgi:hypothetical protein
MRLFFISLLIALAVLSPEIAELQNWDMPGWALMVLRAPHAGLGYMTVFFHELGHTAAMFSFGIPAIPVFNFTDGGGFAQPLMNRTWILQGAVYIGLLYLCWRLFMEYHFAAIGLVIAFMAGHLYFSFGDRHEWAINFMGNGGAVLVGCYCIWRAACGQTYSDHSPVAEKYINMIFGLFAVAKGALLSFSLYTNDLAREIYNDGIGGHIANDFTVIADRLDTRIENVALFFGGYIAFCVAITAVATFMYRRHHVVDIHVKT